MLTIIAILKNRSLFARGVTLFSALLTGCLLFALSAPLPFLFGALASCFILATLGLPMQGVPLLSTVSRTELGTTIEIPRTVHLTLSTPSIVTEKFELIVSDDGPGLNLDKVGNLLKPFHRGDNSMGYGLGLAVVSRIALHHRANVVPGVSDKLGARALLFDFPVSQIPFA